MHSRLKFRFIFISFIFFNCAFANSIDSESQEKIDSLYQVISKKEKNHDTSVAKAYVDLSEAYFMAGVDSLIPLSEVAISFVLKALDENESYSRDEKILHSLDKTLSNAYNNLGFGNKLAGNTEEAFSNYNKGLEFRKKINYLSGVANSLFNIAVLHQAIGSHDSAVHYLQMSQNQQEIIILLTDEADEKMNAMKGKSQCLNNLGLSYHNQLDYINALDSYIKSSKISRKIEDDYGLAYTYNNIGIIYEERGDLEAALKYYFRSLSILKKLENKYNIAYALNNIGGIHKKMNTLDSAKYYFEKSLTLRKEVNDIRGISASYANIGSLLAFEGKYDEAYQYFIESIKLNNQLGDKDGIISSYFMLSDLYFKKQQTDSSLYWGAKAYNLSRENKINNKLKDISQLLYKNYEMKKDWRNAFYFQNLYFKVRDSINDTEIQNKIIKQKVEHEYDLKASADSIKALENKKVMQARIKVKDEQLEKEQAQRNTLYMGSFFLLVLGIFFYNRFRVTTKQKKIISQQKLDVEKQRDLAEVQKMIIEEKSNEILDSINYAKRLQDAILPSIEEIDKEFNDSFVLFEPKDIVSGDFYWMEKKGDLIFLAAADCTGHGVPGAMVSVVCANVLNKVVLELGAVDPAEILNKTKELVIKTFSKSGEDVKDGMDISLCVFNHNLKKLKWAGANNPLWIISEKQIDTSSIEGKVSEKKFDNYFISEIKADKQPVGKYDGVKPFHTQQIPYLEGCQYYMFSDGYADQFGGEDLGAEKRGGKKFKSANMKKLLVELSQLPMKKQKEKLLISYKQWKGELEQIDDICVIGIRV